MSGGRKKLLQFAVVVKREGFSDDGEKGCGNLLSCDFYN